MIHSNGCEILSHNVNVQLHKRVDFYVHFQESGK